MGAIEFRGFSYQDFLNKYASSVLKIMTKVGIISIFTQIFFSKLPKSVGASTHDFEKHGCFSTHCTHTNVDPAIGVQTDYI